MLPLHIAIDLKQSYPVSHDHETQGFTLFNNKNLTSSGGHISPPDDVRPVCLIIPLLIYSTMQIMYSLPSSDTFCKDL